MKPTLLLVCATFFISDLFADFSINITYNGTPPPASQQAEFTNAANAWMSRITGYRGVMTVPSVEITVWVAPIDGPGGTVGSAGPTVASVQDEDGVAGGAQFALVTEGDMSFDSADIDNFELDGTLGARIEHDMGHVLGIGTMWNTDSFGGGFAGTQSLYVSASGQYTGVLALAQWQTEFNQPGATFVPVELGGGGGIANGHWNEVDGGVGLTGITQVGSGQDMRDELMTGWLNSNSFVSQTTLASLEDIGYTVAPEPNAASLEVDFQATIASEQHPDYAGEAKFYHVSTNPANPGTGSFAATIVGTNNPAAPFVRNYDGPVVAYKFAGGTNDDITAVAQSSGASADIITFTTTDTAFDGFGQQQAKLWTSIDPGNDIEVADADPYNVSADTNSTGGWRSLSDATGTIDITALTAGSVHIYYGAFSAKPSVSVVMRDTDGPEPDITIANAHLNDDTANRTEYYLAEIDFVNDVGYDEIEFVWDAGSTNGRGIAVVVTEFVADAIDPTLAPVDIVDSVSGGPIISDGTLLSYTVTYSELMDPATISTDDFEILGTGTAGGTIESVVHYGGVSTVTVLPTVATSGTIQLQVKAGAVLADLAGNELDTTSAIADDTTIVTAIDFTTWVGGFGLTDTTFNGDDDADNLGNGIEGFFGTDPGVFSTGLAELSKSGNQVTFTHPNPDAEDVLTDVTGSYEWSIDLVTWYATDGVEGPGATTVTTVATPDSPTANTTTVVATIAGTVPEKLFLRVEVTLP